MSMIRFAATDYRNRLLCFLVSIGVFAACRAVLDDVARTASDPAIGLAFDRVIIIVGTLLLAALGAAFGKRGLTTAATMLVGAILGTIFYTTWFGCWLLDPTNSEWLLRGDWAQHYAAWESFRSAPWSWPPGRIQTLWYPVGTSIVYTDALPLFAFLFKPFSHTLPADFQYIGLWFLISCVLQGTFAALLVRLFSQRAVIVLCGSALFLLAPIFLGRFFHDTLSAHWLLLAGLWLYFRTVTSAGLAEASPWWLLATTAALVHPYLAAMVLALLFAHWSRRVWVDRAHGFAYAAGAVAVALVLTLLAWWLSGAFLIGYQDGAGGLSYGKHSFNLLGFIIPQGFSWVMPSIPLADAAQWEGSAYLGVGVLTLAALLGAEALWRRRKPAWPRTHWPLLTIAILLIAFAASSVLTVGPWKITDIPVTSPLLATFRASGRFIWIPYYLVLLGVIVGTERRLPRAAPILLAAVVVVHAWEFSLMHRHFAHLRDGAGWPKAETLLSDPAWNEIAANRSHLTMFPPVACGKQAGPYLPFELFAAHHHLTFNSGYLARWDLRATQAYCQHFNEDVQSQRFSDDDVYVVDSTLQPKLVGADFDCQRLDGYLACVLAKNDNNTAP